jgi:hypothetical protein
MPLSLKILLYDAAEVMTRTLNAQVLMLSTPTGKTFVNVRNDNKVQVVIIHQTSAGERERVGVNTTLKLMPEKPM